MPFDLSKPGVESVPCHAFGGGWAFPLNKDGRQALEEYFGESPAPIAPLRCASYRPSAWLTA